MNWGQDLLFGRRPAPRGDVPANWRFRRDGSEPIYVINEHIDRSLELTKIVVGVVSGLIFHRLVAETVRRTARARAASPALPDKKGPS